MTNISAGLKEAERLLENEILEVRNDENVSFLRPVIILFSDAGHNTGVDPQNIAPSVKTKSDIVTVCFGKNADERLMKEIATTPQHCYRCDSGKELRAFLASVGKTMTQTISQNKNATQALLIIRQ